MRNHLFDVDRQILLVSLYIFFMIWHSPLWLLLPLFQYNSLTFVCWGISSVFVLLHLNLVCVGWWWLYSHCSFACCRTLLNTATQHSGICCLCVRHCVLATAAAATSASKQPSKEVLCLHTQHSTLNTQQHFIPSSYTIDGSYSRVAIFFSQYFRHMNAKYRKTKSFYTKASEQAKEREWESTE